MEEPWHIPRASLGSITQEKLSNKSNNNSNHSSRRGTTASGISYLNYYENNNHLNTTNKGLYNRGYNSEDTDHSIKTISEKNLRKSKTLDTRRTIRTINRDNDDDLVGNFDKYSLKRQQRQQQRDKQQQQPINNHRINNTKRDINNDNTEKIHKRGSRSSQGSTDSNHSSHVSSFYAKNLKFFIKNSFLFIFLECIIWFIIINSSKFRTFCTYSTA